MKVSVSILSSNKNPEEMAEKIQKINKTDAEFLHIDVSDGRFVPEKTLEFFGIEKSEKPLDVHLMVLDPFDDISKYAVFNTAAITISLEIDEDIQGLLGYIRAQGMKCGLAIKPETPVTDLEPYFELIDRVLVMSVHPGKSNQKFLPEVLPKIEKLHELREKYHFHYEIFVDGGINGDTVKDLKHVDGVISDSFITKSENYQESIDKLRL